MALQRIQTRDVLFYSSPEVGFQGNFAGVLMFAHSPIVSVRAELLLLTEEGIKCCGVGGPQAGFF